MSITKASFLAITAKTKAVSIPGVDGTLTVREPSAAIVVEYGQRQQSEPTTAAAWLITKCAVDDAGAAMFGEKDAAALAAAPYSTLEPVVDAVLDLAGLKAKIAGPKAGGGTPSPTTTPAA